MFGILNIIIFKIFCTVLKYIGVAIFALLVSYFGRNDHPYKPPDNPGRYTPVINTHPRYFMTVQGYIAPSLNHQVKIVLYTDYLANNDACRYYISSFEGVHAYREVEKIINVVADVDGNYQYKIPLDYYYPGFCGWRVNRIMYKLMTSNLPNYTYDLALFTESNNTKKFFTGLLDWYCRKQSSCSTSDHILREGDDLSTKSNHKFIINIKEQL